MGNGERDENGDRKTGIGEPSAPNPGMWIIASMDDLRRILIRIDQKRFGVCRDIEGSFDYGMFRLYLDHAQGDPYAAHSRFQTQNS